DTVRGLLQKSISLDDNLAEAHLQLGDLYASEHLYDKSIPEYVHALQLNPNLPDAHYRLGTTTYMWGKKTRPKKNLRSIKNSVPSTSPKSTKKGRRFNNSCIPKNQPLPPSRDPDFPGSKSANRDPQQLHRHPRREYKSSSWLGRHSAGHIRRASPRVPG